jgi:NAD(P)-dependent dehydrogenase (short-subunit alcohol dehydrogenase family)
MIDYTGKTALVTGGGSGIGEALAKGLASRGARVLVADRNLEGAQRVVAEIGGAAGAIACELSDPAAPSALIEAAYDRLGRLDLVCSNAGIGRGKRMLKEPFDEISMKVFEVNMLAGFRLAQAYVPRLEASGERGRLMLTGSENSLSVPEAVKSFGMGVYAASKHGLLIMAEWLREETLQKPIDLHVLLPGGVYTPMIAAGLPDISMVPPAMNIILPDRCAEIALKGMDLGLFYIPTHAHIGDDIRPRYEGVLASLKALELRE